MRDTLFSGIQRDYVRKARKTADTFLKLPLVCERALASIWTMREYEGKFWLSMGERLRARSKRSMPN